MADKMRVHILAKELSVPSKTIVEKCKAEGIDTVKNHMSTLSAGLHATILEWFSEGMRDSAVETTERVDLEKVRIKKKRKKVEKTASGEESTYTVETATATLAAPPVSEEPSDALPEELPADDEPASTSVAAEAPPAIPDGQLEVAAPVVEAAQPTDGKPTALPTPIAEKDTSTAPPVDEQQAEPVEVKPEDVTVAEAEKTDKKIEPVSPAGPQNVPAKAKLQGPRVVRYEAPDYDTLPTRRRAPGPQPPAGGTPGGAPGGAPGSAPAPGGGAGGAGDRGGRKKGRRGAGRAAGAGDRAGGWGDRDLAERRQRLAGATGRRIRRRSSQTGGSGGPAVPTGPKTNAKVNEPVRMKDFCSATGLNFMQCFKVLRDEHNLLANVNMTLPTDTAQLLALNFGIDLEVVPAKTRLDELKEEFAARERNNLQIRPPIVTMLGHVDHGKTSLLDAIRNAHVVTGEDGGITQHIGAYNVETHGGSVTFLDTPGHEAFTAMRARGAKITDIVVLIVAADDGIMPQTVEAINHAKAAGVQIVVALNKIDLGDQNKVKIFGQLSEHGLTPSGEWGGEVDVIETSATKGTGIAELVSHLTELSSLHELKADPDVPATGSVVEAETKPGVGAVVRLLIQEGTLRVGDSVVCGPAFGKIRALRNDRAERIDEAGPSCPVEAWGLDDVPAAGDVLYVVSNLQRAKDIATETKQTRIEQARVQSRKVNTLEEMFLQRDSDEIPELNVIIKADVDGSLAALTQTLDKIPSDEVRLSIRHTGVGAVNDSDVLLAAACKGIVIAFRVDTTVKVRRLAERHGVDVRPYRVIYDVADEVKKALEGLLAPERREESRGTAEVRELFRLSKKAGVIAGSYVTNGIVDRSHLAKLVRDGKVIREGCKIGSLRRFKNDAKEVRNGMECGIKLEGFDDLHVGDLIETYEIIEIARTL